MINLVLMFKAEAFASQARCFVAVDSDKPTVLWIVLTFLGSAKTACSGTKYHTQDTMVSEMVTRTTRTDEHSGTTSF